MIYFCSDPHYSHSNLVKGSSKWDDTSECRDFNSVEEHNYAIINGINNTLKENDILYCLGDWSFGNIQNIWNFRKQLRCKKIHLILGNHDHHIESNKELPNCFVRCKDSKLVDVENSTSDWDELCTAKNLFSSVSNYKEIKIYGQRIVLSHYAMRVWNGSHRGTWMLYGHSHDSIEGIEYGKSMDVGFDAAKRILGEWRPFSFTEIKQIMDNRKIISIDHHKENRPR